MTVTILRRALAGILLVFFFATLSSAQNQPAAPTSRPDGQRNDDVEEKNPPDSSATVPAPEIQNIDNQDNDSADVPPFALSTIDNETYFRMRDEHVRLMRGLL